MSELKAFDIVVAEEGYCVGVVKYRRSVYDKSEADKVIEEKDEEIDELKEHIDELQKATDSAWSKVNAMYDELRHHKCKRCLAVARWCDSEANYWYDSSKVQQCWRYGHYIRWFDKWSKLADQFTDKEAK